MSVLTPGTSAITEVAARKQTIRKRPIRDFGGSLCSSAGY
jgi:hypothetical protein